MKKGRKRISHGRDAPAGQKTGAMIALTNDAAWKVLCEDGYKPVMQCAEVQTCIGVYAEMIASMTLRLMRNTEKGDVREKNALSRVLDIRPNKRMTHMTFFHTIVKTMMMYGNQITFPVYRDGYLQELLPLRPSEVSITEEGQDDFCVWYRGKKLHSDEVLNFIDNPNPDEPWRGMGYAASLKDVVRSLRQANATRKAMQESPTPSIIVKVDGLTEEFKSRAGREKLTEQYIDANENGRPWMIPAEAFEVEQVKPLTLNDLAIKTSLELDKRAIASIFGVPAFWVGIGDFNAAEHQHFVTTKIMPKAREIEQEMTHGLLWSPDLYLAFNPRSLYNYSLTELTSVGTQLIDHMAMRRNELRDWLGLPPDAEMDEVLALENYIPASRVGDQKKLKGGGDKDGADDAETDPDE